jgi:hypothetical protein
MDGSPPVRLGSGAPQELSRDGRWALAVRGGAIVALPTAAGAERVVETKLPAIVSAHWMPDSAHVLVMATDEDGTSSATVFGFDGGPSRSVAKGLRLRLRLTSLNTSGRASRVSPDGRFVAAAMASGGVVVLPLDGGPPRPVPDSRPNDLLGGWSRDGRRLFVFDPSGLPGKVHAVDLASGRRELWREIPVDPVGCAGVERVVVTPDGTAYVYSHRQHRSNLYLVKGLR